MKSNQKFDQYLNFALMEKRMIMISEGVSSKLTRRVLSQLLILDSEDSKAEITVLLNSPGGSADDGFAIYDAFCATQAPIKIICTGLVASAGTIMLCGTEKANRMSLSHTRIMMHQPSSGIMGTASDIKISAEEIVKLREKANVILAKATGQTKKKIAEDTNRDFWLNSKEAMEYGLIGKIVDNIQDM